METTDIKKEFQGATRKDQWREREKEREKRERVADSQASICLKSSCQLFTSLEAHSPLWKLEKTNRSAIGTHYLST